MTDLLAVDKDCADQFVLLEHRHAHHRPVASEVDGGHEDRLAVDISGLRLDIDDMNRLPRFDDAAEDRSRISHELPTFFEKCFKFRRRVRQCGRMKLSAPVKIQDTELCVANSYRVLQHGLKYGFKLAGRA